MSNYPTRKSFKSLLRDRPKHSGKLLAHTLTPRKGGAGKGNVGRPGDEVNQPATDPADPNWTDGDDEDESLYFLPSSRNLLPSSSTSSSFSASIADYNRFKAAVRKAAAEYITSLDQLEFVTTVDELQLPLFHQDIPYIVIRYSFDRSDGDRNTLSSLLLHATKPSPASTLATSPPPLLTPQHFAHSFLKLCYSLTDLTLDAPNARLYIREYAQFFVAGGVLDAKVWARCEKYEEMIGNESEIRALKAKIAGVVEDLFVNEEVDYAIESIESLQCDSLHYEVIKAILRSALDRNNRQRELTSRFLAYTVNSLFAPPSIEKAFSTLLERVEDLYLDVPDVLHLLSVFIARAVVDECLSPSFLARVDVDERDLGAQVLRQVGRLLEGENKWERMERCWKGEKGAGGGGEGGSGNHSRGGSFVEGEIGRRRSTGGGAVVQQERKEAEGEELKQ